MTMTGEEIQILILANDRVKNLDETHQIRYPARVAINDLTRLVDQMIEKELKRRAEEVSKAMTQTKHWK